MEMIIAILLWIGCITAPNHYTESAINNYSRMNEPVINDVLSNEPQQVNIWDQYGYLVPTVIIDPYQSGN